MAKDDKFRGSSGSSGRVDVEIKASEDSSAPPRKRIKLNSDSQDRYGVPLQVLSLSPMSSSERKGLICRFKFELEQIRMLQNKVEMQRINAVMMMKQCETLLNRLVDHRYAWVFREPIDAVKLDIPDYLTVIKHPMDLGTIQSKLNSGSYSSPLEFAADVKLTFRNAMEYNPEGHNVHMMADCLSKFFEQGWKTIEKKIPDTEPQILQAKGRCEESQIPEVSPLKRRKIDSYKVETVTEPERRALKQNLGREHSETELSNESGLSSCSMHRQQKSSVESNPCQYGESTSTESSQVSPDKLIRNAMIKNRFADTILKAREKALTQVDKRDPKKLRREMEELEMQRKKEKARLQAEAEARKKREFEREAARQALLQMEKTVEIDDSLRFMEDLKILGVAPAERLPSSSTDHSQDGLASFRSDGSNPLQQTWFVLDTR